MPPSGAVAASRARTRLSLFGRGVGRNDTDSDRAENHSPEASAPADPPRRIVTSTGFITGFFRFWYDFIVGDAWDLAAGTVVVLVVGVLLA